VAYVEIALAVYLVMWLILIARTIGEKMQEPLDKDFINQVIPQPRMSAPKPNPPMVEYAVLYAGGSMLVRPNDIESIYPLEQWLPNQKIMGGKVYRRTILIVEDWEECT
jgi:hypothetical protein